MDNVVQLSARRPARSEPSHSEKGAVAPVTSLALVLRSAPRRFSPYQVALDLLAPGSRPAAVPIWNERKRGFLELLHSYGLHGPAARKIAADWTAAIAVAGEAEKQHRRQKREAEIKAVERFFAEEFK